MKRLVLLIFFLVIGFTWTLSGESIQQVDGKTARILFAIGTEVEKEKINLNNYIIVIKEYDKQAVLELKINPELSKYWRDGNPYGKELKFIIDLENYDIISKSLIEDHDVEWKED